MDKENLRARLWAECWMAVASASNCTSKQAADSWADHMLAELDKRFPDLMNSEPTHG